MVKQKKHACIRQSGKKYAISWNAWFVTSFCTDLTLLHCLKKKTALLLTNQNGEIFSCILLIVYTVKPLLYLIELGCIWELGSSKLSGLLQNVLVATFTRDNVALTKRPPKLVLRHNHSNYFCGGAKPSRGYVLCTHMHPLQRNLSQLENLSKTLDKWCR